MGTRLSDKLLNKPVCLLFLIAGLIYGNGILFCFGNNPASPLGTLSILCEDRKYLFWIWALFVAGGYFLNAHYAYRKFGERAVWLRALCVIALLACCGVGLTLKHDVTTWNPKRIAHWIASGIYMAALGLSILAFLLKNAKKYKGFWGMAALVFLSIAMLAAWLLILGKSGLMEMIPNSLLTILLLYLNFLMPVRPRKASDTEQSPATSHQPLATSH